MKAICEVAAAFWRKERAYVILAFHILKNVAVAESMSDLYELNMG